MDEAIRDELLRVVQPAAVESAIMASEEESHPPPSTTSFLKLYNETSRRRVIACNELRSNMILPTRRIVWWRKSWNDAGMPLCSKSRNWKHVWIGTFKARAAGYDQAATNF